MPTFDPARPHTIVGGRLPLYYIQSGHGFSRNGAYLGEFDAQGDFVSDMPAPAAETGTALADESGAESGTEPSAETGAPATSETAAAETTEPETAANPDMPATPAEPESEKPAAEPYRGVKAATMKRMIEERGLDFEPSATRDDLVAILVADDSKGNQSE